MHPDWHLRALTSAARRLRHLDPKGGGTSYRMTGKVDERSANVTGPAPLDPIFPRLLKDEDSLDHRLIGFIAYGLYEEAKREWVSQFHAKEGRYPSQIELQAYESTWTASRTEAMRNSAVQLVSAYADEVTTRVESDIMRRSLRGSLWRSFWHWILSAVVFSLSAIGLYIICRQLGLDPVSFIDQLATPHP
jgi:hypothetical protein